MHWFVVLAIATVYWGNGQVEERKDWSYVYFGSTPDCRAEAGATAQAQAETLSRKSRYQKGHRGEPHPRYPETYSGPITAVKGVRHLCVRFGSVDDIKAALPARWPLIGGCRRSGADRCAAFDWRG